MKNNITTDDMLFAMQQRNLVYNYNFLYYSNQANEGGSIVYNHPDGWLYTDPGKGKIGFDVDNKACIINKSNDSSSIMNFSQNINEFPRWKNLLLGQTITAEAVVSCPTVGADFNISFYLEDGISENHKSDVIVAGESKTITVEIMVSNSATHLAVGFKCSTNSAIILIHKVYVNIGKIALEYLPCMVNGFIGERKQYISIEVPPAEELSLCEPSTGLSDAYTRLNSFLNGRFGFVNTNESLLPDMRGYFSRSWDNNAGIDTGADERTPLGQGEIDGDHVGTVEEDAFKEHDHELDFNTNGKVSPGQSPPSIPVISLTAKSNTRPRGDLETRSKNISELYTIKWA
ncbi:MAG: hypothetical protein HKN09_05805 [Saprospiraceae bacterium]|nr:hypothetical protein [Saprospiraceae bacterium]